MKTLKFLFLTLFVMASLGSMAQNEIKMHTGTVNIGEGKTYYFFDSGGEEEFTVAEDPNNDYRWKTWYNHNEVYTLTFKVPENSTKGIKVTFRSLLINNDHLIIYEGNPGDSLDMSKRIVDLTNNDYSTDYGTFTVMSHGNMNIRFRADGQWRDAGWIAEVKLEDFTPQAPVVMRRVCENKMVILPTCKGNNSTLIYYNMAAEPTNPDNNSAAYTIGKDTNALSTYPFTMKAIAYIDGVASGIGSQTITSEIAAPPFTTDNYTHTEKENIIDVKTLRDNNINDTWYVRYIMNNTATQTVTDAANWPAYDEDNLDGYQEIVNPGGTIDYTNTTLTPDFYVHMLIRGTTCPDKFSAIQTVKVEHLYIPKPEISFDNSGSTTITSALSDVTIYYTTDGSEPTTSSVEYEGAFNVTAGTTVKAIAVKNGYEDSETACEIYSTGSSVSSSVVLIDDREDHNMSYYQKAADLPTGYPTEYLSSPDPRNVKITYKGGSVSGASAVAISALDGEGQNEMIYLKTMEKTVIGMTGNYPYTVISNPFSKRPVTGSGNNKTYYGFVGWKVISGGEYISEYSNGQTLPLDATIHFVNLDNNYTPNCLSAEIVFEATWTTANVQTGNSAPSFNNNGTYETNFWVLSGNSNIGNITVPANSTVSARYPDGTVNFTRNLTGTITASGDNAKVEFVNMNSTGDVNAAGYTFTMGRGITNSGNGGQLQGCTSNKACNHTVKIESGKYASLRHFTNDISSGNAINQLMILGCDYDRAKGDNAKLNITGSMYIANQTSLNRTAGTLYVRSIVKSGNFISATTVGNNYSGSADECYYFSGFGSNDRTGGRRYLVVEGGHLRGISGGTDIENNTAQNSSRAFELRVRGTAQIDGVVYGAAQYANGSGHRTMIFTGGTINGWIAGGANGTQQTDGATNGTSYVYVGGKTNVNSNASTTILNHAIGGNVFGAGCGYNANSTSGQVQQGTNVVIADEAYVERGVYGGGSYGYTEATANIYILGGTIDGKAGGVDGTSYDAKIPGGVYGGACQNKGGVANIIMNNGTVNGSIYGGSNSNGTLSGNVTLSITGGEVKGNVFGGGYGQNTNVAGNVAVTIGEKDAENGPTIGARDEDGNLTEGGDVYGGGALGKVNTTSASNTTYVTVNSGTINNVYGGGLGMKGDDPETYTINISWSFSASGMFSSADGSITCEYKNSSGETTSFTRTNGSSQQITVKANTNIKLTAESNNWRTTTTITASYVGGSQIGSVSASNNNSNNNTFSINGQGDANNNASIAANVGTVTVDIKGGTMNKVFGCNNLNGAPQGSVTVNFDGGEAVDVYGGGNLADYLPNTTLFPTVNITDGKVTNSVYGGGAFARVNKTIVNMTGGEAGSVYAGAQGDDKNKKLVNYNKTVNMQGGTAIMVYGGSFTCLDSAKSFVNISGGRVKTHVFGSGYFGDMKGDCYVYIGKNAIEKAPNTNLNTDKGSHNSNKPIWIESNVYAGANWGSFQGTFGEATITGASNIYIDGTGYNMDHGKTGNYMIIGGSVYGSGTSCAAGTTDHSIIVRKYGNMTYPSMTRSLKSIQRASYLILDSSSIDFIGQGDISSMDPTVEYGIINIDTIYATNGNNMALSKPLDNVNKLGSYTCANVYATTPSFTINGYGTPKNGIVINNGGYLMVRYDTTVNNTPEKYYGELAGYFYMREPGDDAGINNEGYIFARPKIIKANGESYVEKQNENYDVFASDGGFVDFDANESDTARNTFDENGNKVRNRKRVEGPAVQMPYTNRTDEVTKNRSTVADNSTDYRFWRFEPDTVPTVTREVVFVVKADEDAGDTTTKFLTTTGSVQLPPALSETNKYYITGLTWGADGKDCNPANITKTGADEDNREWKYYDEGFKNTTDSNENNSIAEYFANPNSTFGFLMRFGGNLKTQDPMILDNNSFQNYFNEHALAEVGGEETTKLPELDFLVTYSDRLSQNEMWAEARMIIEERDASGNLVQKIYLNISVTTITKFGQDVETYVYASTAGDRVSTYTAQLNLPTFALAENTKFYATFKAAQATKPDDFGKIKNTTVVTLVNYDENNVKDTNSSYLALQFNAESNEDNTNGWYHKGDAQNPNQPVYFDFNKVLNGNTPNDSVVGASDGRKYTTIAFDLLYNPLALKKVDAFGIGQKHVGDLFIKMVVDNIEGGINTFNITVHVYVTGPTKFYYLDGVAGKDGNSGMFPDKAKKTLNGVLNASGYTVEDPVFVVNGVTPKAGASLTWNANKFLNSVTVPEEDQNKYTEEQVRQLSQVKVYRYPGGHPKEAGETNSTNDFYNGMYTGQIINVPAGTQFAMHNVCLSGGSDLDNNKDYNPNEETMEAAYPLISIGKGATVSIENSSLVYNNNTSTTAIAGAIYNEGNLTMDGVYISGNTSEAESGKGAGVYYHKDGQKMELGNTQTITIEDQVYLDDKKFMEVPTGTLLAGSMFKDILVYYNPKLDTSYSGRVIVRYDGAVPSAPELPYWKNNLPDRQTSMLKSRKAADDEETQSYESDKYTLNPTITAAGFEKANGGDPNVLPFITSKMKTEFDPITSSDIIMYSVNANLPVELLYFHATCMGDAVQFEWATASETNNEYFTIERSTDAVHYEEVARIQGAGTTSLRSEYSFMSDNINSGMTYYRLRQTDIDGAEEVFSPVALQCTAEQATVVDIYPVPARDIVNIVSMGEAISRVEVYTIQGSRLMSMETEGTRLQMNVADYAAGAYVVKLTTATGETISRKLIVNK
ncbi:MAG: chitobiase/beta-hexosaminidase C-terminal domain-containing protein [Bacteroidales bacterium]|nr:chitobiase/beta-hexosaminidase C-terminal domain-containing protein [Bacteroidales bacterium]